MQGSEFIESGYQEVGESLPLFLSEEGDDSWSVDTWEMFGDKGNKGKPPPKIQGTEHKWREQKQKVKLIIRLPWQPKPKPK
jgi:hypothetical protein